MPTAGPLLPDRVSTCLFDLDGVLTQTAKVHAAAWKEMFDAFLLERSRETGEETRRGAVTADGFPGHRKEERRLSAPLRVFG